MEVQTNSYPQIKPSQKAYETKDRISNVTNDSQTRLSDFSEEHRELESLQIFQNDLLYKKIFQKKVKQTEITPNLHKKAINWLVTFCWTRNFSEEILWYSIGFFYAYSCSCVIKKERLTLILISTVNLSLKLHQPDSSLGFSNMKTLLNDAWDIQQFERVQSQLVQLFQFDLYYPTLLGHILRMDRSEQEIYKILFLAQSFFMNSFQPAINDLLLDDILILVTQPSSQSPLKTEIMKLHKNGKTLDTLKQKYSSKFDIDDFLNQILSQN